MRWNQRMALTMSLSGMFNVGHDIGGFCRTGAEPGNADPLDAGVLPGAVHDHELDGRPDGVNSPWLHAERHGHDPRRSGLRLRL